MRAKRIPLVAIGLALVASGPAAAQRPGVVVDPDSPSAKQYRLPLESARHQADPRGDGRVVPPVGQPPGGSAAPLFGEGIVTTRSGEGRGVETGGAVGSAGDATLKSPLPSRVLDTRRSRNAVQAAVSNPGAPSGGIGSTLLIVAGGGFVLLVGGLVGGVMRRRSAN